MQITSSHPYPGLSMCVCRTMTDAGPLTRMTTLKSLHVWLGASHELPPCSNKPLRGLMTALGHLTQLTQLQLLKGLYLSWELRKIVHLDALTDLQVGSVTTSVHHPLLPHPLYTHPRHIHNPPPPPPHLLCFVHIQLSGPVSCFIDTWCPAYVHRCLRAPDNCR